MLLHHMIEKSYLVVQIFSTNSATCQRTDQSQFLHITGWQIPLQMPAVPDRFIVEMTHVMIGGVHANDFSASDTGCVGDGSIRQVWVDRKMGEHKSILYEIKHYK